MKLVRYSSDGLAKPGVLLEEKIVDLADLARKRRIKLPGQLSDLILTGPESMESVQRLIAGTSRKDIGACSVSLSEAKLLAPVPFPPKIICLGLNYRDHVEETGRRLPDEPVIFMKPHTAIIGPNESIVKPNFVRELDYEAELAIVIGKKGKDIPVGKASEHVFGYTILNDVSARDIQFKDKQWTRGKGFDTFAPTGPCITTADELRDTSNLSIRTWVNGELRQNSSTKEMVFKVEQIIYHLSRVMTLEPCDIIATGTPSGVGFKMKPHPKFLQAGDIVKIDIKGIGVLQNSIVNESKSRLGCTEKNS